MGPPRKGDSAMVHLNSQHSQAAMCIARARLAKAQALAARIAKDGVTAISTSQADDAWWQLAAEQAGVRLPSVETRALVVALLEQRERAVCPRCGSATCEAWSFRGFPGGGTCEVRA